MQVKSVHMYIHAPNSQSHKLKSSATVERFIIFETEVSHLFLYAWQLLGNERWIPRGTFIEKIGRKVIVLYKV